MLRLVIKRLVREYIYQEMIQPDPDRKRGIIILTDYKRMVSYMYQYEDGIKKRNVGFVRVEAKGGQCKITLHMQLLGQLDSIFPTYLMQRGKHGIDLIYLGDAVLKNQVMDSKLSADENNVMGSGFALSQMSGLLLFLNDKIFYATIWDDMPVVAHEVMEALRPGRNRNDDKRKESVAKNMELNQETVSNTEYEADFLSAMKVQKDQLLNEINMPRYMLPGGYKMVERQQWKEPVKMDGGYPKDEKSDLTEMANLNIDNQSMKVRNVDEFKPEIVEEDIGLVKPEGFQEFNNVQQEFETYNNFAMEHEYNNPDNAQYDNFSYQDIKDREFDTESKEQLFRLLEEMKAAQMREETKTDTIQSEGKFYADPPAIRHLFDNYPRIYPFEDNVITQCVKIEPKDIGLLPKEIWPYSNNSFLMHGYYCYHHLIFAIMKNGYNNMYILGVPGIYHGREQFMARMFGFNHFKSIKKREVRQGDFGYWYLPVNLTV